MLRLAVGGNREVERGSKREVSCGPSLIARAQRSEN